ncbi:MAG: hypothetical protein WC457_01560 [Patescibacteria group bacterium]
MKMSPLKSIIVFTVILATVVVALIVGAFIVQNKIVAGSMAVNEQIERLNKKRLTAENLRSNLALAKDVKTQIANYDSLLLPQSAELELITDLENIAAKNKVNQRIDASNLDNYTNGKIEITLNVSGTYTDVLKYISSLEQYKYLITIERIDFSPGASNPTDGNSQPRASSQIKISLYANPE